MPEALSSISYLFHIEDKEDVVFEVLIDSTSMTHSIPQDFKEPEWSSSFKCSFMTDDKKNCCSLCKCIAYVTNEFKDIKVDTPATISVRTENRNYTIKQNIKTGLFSILGLYMSTSNCPHFAFLKPMAKFHLPFASDIETVFRSIGTYLLGEYFRFKDGIVPDWDLQALSTLYEQVSKIDLEIAEHLKKISPDSIEPIMILNSFADLFTKDIKEKLDKIEPFYSRK